MIKFDSHGNRFSHLGVTALYLQKTTWKISCLGQTSTLLGALASNIHRCLSYMCRLSWIIIMALTFCGKKSEVGHPCPMDTFLVTFEVICRCLICSTYYSWLCNLDFDWTSQKDLQLFNNVCTNAKFNENAIKIMYKQMAVSRQPKNIE